MRSFYIHILYSILADQIYSKHKVNFLRMEQFRKEIIFRLIFYYIFCSISILMNEKSQISTLIANDKRLNQIYTINRKISNGCFGYIYLVTHKQFNRKSAIKVELIKPEINQTIKKEYTILLKLQGIKGIPIVYNFGYSEHFIYLQLQLLENDLSYLTEEKGMSNISLICNIASELIKILEAVHDKKIIHRDLKPQNIMLDKSGNVYLVDFGISKQIGRYHMPEAKKKRAFVGTPRYASIAAHKGKQQTPMDDLESLMYNLIYLAKKKLPWVNVNIQTSKKLEAIMQMKQKISKNELCQGLPNCFLKMFEHINKTKLIGNLNYNYMSDLFRDPQKFATEKYVIKKTKQRKSQSNMKNRRTSIESSNLLVVPNFSNMPNPISTTQKTLQFSNSEQVMRSSNQLLLDQQEEIENFGEQQQNELSVCNKIQALIQLTRIPKFKMNQG